jgi:hypothetical protein
MARQGINTGSSPDAGDGDALLTGAIKINANFNEIYTALGDGTNITNSIGFAVTAGISTYATRAGIATYATTAGIATYANSSRVVIKDSGSTVGTAGTIDFGDNLTVSAVSAGVVTVTAASGTSSQWVTTAAGIHTLSNIGIGTTNPTSALTVVGSGTSTSQLYVTGVSTFNGYVSVAGTASFRTGASKGVEFVNESGGGTIRISNDGGNTQGRIGFNGNATSTLYANYANGDINLVTGNDFSLDLGSYGTYALYATKNGSVSLYNNGNKKFETLGAGVTITGTTFTNQLSVSGDANISGVVTASQYTVGQTKLTDGYLNLSGNIYWGSIFLSGRDLKFVGEWDGGSNYGDYVFYKRDTFGGLIEVTKIKGSNGYFTTIGSGNFGGNLNVSGVSTFSGSVGIGTTNPTSALTVQGDVLVSGVSTFGNPNIATDNLKISNVGDVTLQPGRLIYLSGNTNVGIRWTSALGMEIYNGNNLGGDDRKITIQSLNEGDIVLKGQYDNRAVFTNNGVTITGTTFTNQLSVSGVSTFSGSVGIGTTNPVDGYNLTLGAPNTGIRTTSLKVYGYADINGLTVKGNSRDYNDNVIITQNPSATFYGSRNVAIGDGSFTTPGATVENVAIGYYALNVVGNNDGLNTYNGNTAVGAFAGQSATTTLRNTFIGNYSGRYITTGRENTILGGFDGNQNGLDIRTSSNNVVLSDGAGNIRLYANSSGNVGLGTTNPTVKLEVNGSARVGIDTSAGVILTSPNGTKYQLFVENDGTLKTVAV